MLKPDPSILRLWVLLVGGIFEVIGTLCAGFIALYKFAQTSKKPSTEVRHKTESEAELNEARAQSIEFQDQLSAFEMMQRFIKTGLALEQALQRKNEIIAQLEDKVYDQNLIIERQAGDIKAYEAMKLNRLGNKQLRQAENGATGTDEG